MTEHKEAVPVRVQLSRKKGWKMPPNTVKVARPTAWGNPFLVSEHGQQGAVNRFRDYIEGMVCEPSVAASLNELRGKNLACWCKIVDQHGNAVPCHADVLLELANRPLEGEQ